jgi:hypothetical protein
VPDFYDSQAADEQAAQAQPGEVAIPSPSHQHREQAPSLLAGHVGHARGTASPALLVPPQRTDAETLVREKVEKAIQSSVAVFVEAERRRIEAETAQIELETENLQVRGMACRRRGALQYNTIQYNTIQYNTIRYATLHSRFVEWLSWPTTWRIIGGLTKT